MSRSGPSPPPKESYGGDESQSEASGGQERGTARANTGLRKMRCYRGYGGQPLMGLQERAGKTLKIYEPFTSALRVKNMNHT